MADDAGVLTEDELNAWMQGVLVRAAAETPLNAPVGEESWTEDGYAFLYSFATLYYAQPDSQSQLRGLSVTEESLDTPRGIRLDAPVEMLLNAYGWQNPSLAGDESFAALYVLDQMPQNAYWAWAQRGAEVQSVQCAIHAACGEDAYTDTGIRYTVANGLVTGIQVYGLDGTIPGAEVESNLKTVQELSRQSTAILGVTQRNEQAPFAQGDLQFSHIDFLTLTDAGATRAFGEPVGETWAQDDAQTWLHSVEFEGVSVVFSCDANKQNPRLDTIAVSDASYAGPRGVSVGMSLEDVTALFCADGSGKTRGTQALLYGDGETPPFGTLERSGSAATLRYGATVQRADGTAAHVSLHLTFESDVLTEWMIFTW